MTVIRTFDPPISVRDANKEGSAFVRLSDVRIIYAGMSDRMRCAVICVSSGDDTPISDELVDILGPHTVRLEAAAWEPLGDYVDQARALGADLIFSLSEI